jgi:glycosidase
MFWWMGMSGADGLRFDVLSFIPRTFWSECLGAFKREFPDYRTIGEVNGEIPATVSYFQGGKPGFDGIDTKLDSVFDFPLRKAMRSVFLEGQPMEHLPVILSEDRLYPNPMMLVTCFGLHDDPRFMGHPGATSEALKLAFAFILTTRGIPLIYYGDEIAMPGGSDPDNRRDFPGGWPEDSHNAFLPSGRTETEAPVFDYVQRLTRLRSECAVLRRGRLINLYSSDKVYAYARVLDSEQAIIILNNGDQVQNIDLPIGALRLRSSPDLSDQLGSTKARLEGGRIKSIIPRKTAALYTFHT